MTSAQARRPISAFRESLSLPWASKTSSSTEAGTSPEQAVAGGKHDSHRRADDQQSGEAFTFLVGQLQAGSWFGAQELA